MDNYGKQIHEWKKKWEINKADENDGEPVDDLALMKRAYTNKKTGQIDDGLVREVVSLVQTQVQDEVSQLQTEDDDSTASTNLSRFRINEIVESGLIPRNIPRDTFLGIFRGTCSSEIPDENSEEHFVGTSEDWTIGKSIEISRGSSPSVYSEELFDELVVLGVSSEFCRKFPRKFRGKKNFRGVISEDLFRRLSPQQATTTNGSAYSTLEPPKASHPIICKKLHSLGFEPQTWM
uniref:Uncharacterized protein n=1 Tax=Brassica oleracea var. oleracea TaxID=109376 RepID=A0A0D3CDH5_BRAOL